MNKFTLALCLSFILSLPALAAKVTAVKGGKVMVNLEGADVNPGDEFFLINPASNKKSAIVRVKQVKNGKAIADIITGRAAVDSTLQAKASSAGKKTVAKTAPSTERQHETLSRAKSPEEEAAVFDNARDMSFSRTLKNSYGVLGQYAMDKMTPTIKESVAINPAEQPELTGSGLGAGGFYEWVLTRNITVRTLGVIEQFNVSGNTQKNVGCKGSTACSANITYLSGYALGKYYFTQGRIRSWAGIGGGFLIAMSKSATALDENQIATNQVMTLAAGGEYQLNRKTYIPFSIQYVYFPPSSTVTASAIVFQVGYGWQ
jgi:outer membrane protein W